MTVVRLQARPRFAAALILALLAVLPVAPGATAGTDTPHPAHIHSGACPAPGDIVADLSNVSPDFLVDGAPAAANLPVGAATARPIEASVTTVDMPLADIVAADHAIVVHASAEDMATYLVCGDIGGRTLGTTELPIALDPVGESGYHGFAVLRDVDATQTQVAVYLVEDAPASPDGEPPTGTQTVEVGSTLYFSGFDITVETATFDPEAGSLEVTAVFDNLGTGASNLTSLQLNGHPTVVWNDEVVPLRIESASAPAGAATRASLTSTNPPEGFSLDEASLVFGDASQHQASVALEPGAIAVFEEPRDITLPRNARRVVLRGVARIQITHAQLVPAGCAGSREAVTFTPAPATELSLVLTVTVRGLAPAGALLGTFATAPDRTTGVGGPGVLATGRGETDRDLLYCYTVPMPGPGRYAVRFEASDRAGTVRLNVPEAAPEG